MSKPPVEDLDALEGAIRRFHGCGARWVEAASVKEIFEGETVWDGTVQVFDLLDHPTATRCYAWSHVMDDLARHKFYAVLHADPIDSPEKAVQAAIAKDSQEAEG